jgi:hypothetical protein
MIESLKSAATISRRLHAGSKDAGMTDPVATREDPNPLRQTNEPAGEAASLAAAIQRLITERDSHKLRAGNTELELTRLRAVNEELRRQHEQTLLLADHYMRLATEVLTTLKNIDATIHEVVQRSIGAATASSESRDAALMSLVRRLSPRGAANDHSDTGT